MRSLVFTKSSPWTPIFWGAWTLWVGLEIAGSRIKQSDDSSNASDRGSLTLIVVLWWLGMATDFASSLLLPQAAMEGGRAPVFVTGVVLMLGGVAFRWYCIAILGPYFTFSVAIQRDQTLIEAGPYRYLRHPSYTGALISILGFGLALGNAVGLAAFLACMSIAYAYRIPVEEAALTAGLGDAYVKYMSRTWRLMPFLF